MTTQFTFTTGYACYGNDITVTIEVDGEELSIVSAVQDGVVIDTNVVGEEYDSLVSVLLLEAAEDYAHDHKLYETEDRYVPERKHWEIAEDKADRFWD